MIALEVEIDPGVRLVELPHSRRDAVGGQCFSAGGQAAMRSHPDALLFGKNLTHPVAAATALTVPGMFGTLRLRAEKTNVLDGAITAMLAVQKGPLGGIFQA